MTYWYQQLISSEIYFSVIYFWYHIRPVIFPCATEQSTPRCSLVENIKILMSTILLLVLNHISKGHQKGKNNNIKLPTFKLNFFCHYLELVYSNSHSCNGVCRGHLTLNEKYKNCNCYQIPKNDFENSKWPYIYSAYKTVPFKEV